MPREKPVEEPQAPAAEPTPAADTTPDVGRVEADNYARAAAQIEE